MTQQASPRISVIVRTIGHACLPRALESARTQTWPDIQIVLVAAAPHVEAAPWAGDSRIHVVAPGEPLNRPRAANAGLDSASGDWLLFLDEDDWIEPQHVETLWRAANEAPGVLLAYADTMIHKEGQPLVHERGYWRQTYPDRPVFANHAALFSRRLLELGCRFDEQFVLLEDWDFFLQCAEHTDFLHVPVASAHYDPHAGTSGGGIGVNRDEARIKPYVDALTAKWGQRYAEIAAQANEALRQGDEALARRDYAAARAAALAGLSLDPGNPLLLNRLAACAREAGDLGHMIKALRRACDSDRQAFRMHLELAALEHRLGFTDRARALAGRLAEMARTQDEFSRVAGLREYLERRAPAVSR